MLCQKILEFQSPKLRFPVFWGPNFVQISVFFIQDNIHVAFIQVSYPHNQFLQAVDKCQYSELRTFACKQSLRKLLKNMRKIN